MAGMCSTEIQIHGTGEDIRMLRGALSAWTKPEGGTSICEIAEKAGIPADGSRRFPDGDHSRLMSWDDGDDVLRLHQYDAGGPELAVWRAILLKYVPDCRLLYTAEAPEDDLYITNDPRFIGKYEIEMEYDRTGELFSEEEMREVLRKHLKKEAPEGAALEELIMIAEEDPAVHVIHHRYRA